MKRFPDYIFENNLFASNYYLKKFLGSGQFGAVYLADEVIDGNKFREVAVKIIQKSNDSIHQKLITRELQIACNLNHSNILQCFCPVKGSLAYTDNQTNQTRINSYKGLVMEIASLSLESYLKKKRLSEKEVRDIIIEITEGLAYLHSRIPPVVHRDLKPANILQVDGIWKLADFGIARPLDNGSIAYTQVVGTPQYISPEALKDEIVSTAGDMWALGIIIIEMLSGQYPYSLSGNSIRVLCQRIKNEKPNIPPLPAPFDRIVKNCLVKDRKQRWTAQQVLDVLQETVTVPNSVTTVIPNNDTNTIIPSDSMSQKSSSTKPTKTVDPDLKTPSRSSQTVVDSSFPLWQKVAISAVLMVGMISGISVFSSLPNPFIEKEESPRPAW